MLSIYIPVASTTRLRETKISLETSSVEKIAREFLVTKLKIYQNISLSVGKITQLRATYLAKFTLSNSEQLIFNKEQFRPANLSI